MGTVEEVLNAKIEEVTAYKVDGCIYATREQALKAAIQTRTKDPAWKHAMPIYAVGVLVAVIIVASYLR